MTTPILIAGFENGVATPTVNGGGLYNTVNGSPTVGASYKKTGAYGLQINPSATTEYVSWDIATGTKMVVGRVYVYFVSLPSGADGRVISCYSAHGGAIIGVDTTGKWFCEISGGTRQTAASGPSTSQWYMVEFKFDTTSNPHLADWKIDTVSKTQATSANAAEDLSAFRAGTTLATTMEVWYDDLVLSATSGDYPIGPGGTEVLVPSSNGSLLNTNGYLQDAGGVAIDLPGNPCNTDLDDIPPSASAYVLQTTAASTYMAANDMSNISASHSGIIGAMAFLAYTSAATQANTAACMASKDAFSTETVIWGDEATPADYSDGSTSNLYYKSAIVSGVVDDTTANALQIEIGHSGDATPDPYWIDTWIELAYKVSTVQTHNITGTVNATSSTTTAGKNTISFTGTVNATSSTTTVGSPAYRISGTVNATSSTTTVGKRILDAKGTVSATSSTTAVGKMSIFHSGTVTATSSLVVAGKRTISFSGTVNATSSTVTVGFTGLNASGTVNATSSTTAVGKRTLNLSGTISATSSTTIVGKNAISFAGTVSATSSTVTAGKRTLNLSGTVTANSSLVVVGTTAGFISFAGTVNATSSLVVQGIRTIPVTGTVQASSSTVTIGRNIVAFTGAVLANSSTVIVGKRTLNLSGQIIGTSSVIVIGSTAGFINFTGTVQATSSLVAAGSRVLPLAGTVQGTSALTTLGKRILDLSGTVQGTSSLNLFAAVLIVLYGTVQATSRLTVIGFTPSLIKVIHFYTKQRPVDFVMDERPVEFNTKSRSVETEVPRE